jgi:hypothetical protein
MSKPKLFLIVTPWLERRPRLKAKEPFPGADHAVVEGVCPGCGHQEPEGGGFKAAGTGRRISSDDRAYEADAVALCCEKHVGTLRLEPNTFFGIREDEAITRLGIKIY